MFYFIIRFISPCYNVNIMAETFASIDIVLPDIPLNLEVVADAFAYICKVAPGTVTVFIIIPLIIPMNAGIGVSMCISQVVGYICGQGQVFIAPDVHVIQRRVDCKRQYSE